MHRVRKYALVLAAAAVLTAGLSTAVPALASPAAPPACGGTGATTTTTGALKDTATYEIQCPAGPWNGQLFLYSHGYVVPNSPNPAQDAQDATHELELIAGEVHYCGPLRERNARALRAEVAR